MSTAGFSNCFLAIDAQCLQTGTVERGIGRYSLQLIASMCRARPTRSIAALLTNVASPRELTQASRLLEDLMLPNLEIRVLDAFANGNRRTSRSMAAGQVERQVNTLSPKAVLTLSPFETPELTVPMKPSTGASRFAVLYDVIPLLFPKDLLFTRRAQRQYHQLLDKLQQQTALLAISGAAARDFRQHVSSRPDVHVIGGGPGTTPVDVDRSTELALRFGFLVVGAESEHKNVLRAIMAFAQLPIALRQRHPLVIVGIRASGVNRRLSEVVSSLGDTVLVEGYVSESRLQHLYRSVRAVVVPSLAEGLGLPVLESWQAGGIALGGAGTAVAELIADERATFNPYDIVSIAACMNLVATDDAIWMGMQAHGQLRLTTESWDAVAERAWLAIDQYVAVAGQS